MPYVIFITENNVRGEIRVLYHFEWKDTETGKPLGDGAHIIYVNAAYHNESDNSNIAKLMHDFRCCNPEDMNYELLAEKVKFFKETEEGVSHMCKLNEEMRNETAEMKSVEIALKMLKKANSHMRKLLNTVVLLSKKFRSLLKIKRINR